MVFKVYCENTFYGSECVDYCLARDNVNGHYTCNETTGDKLCLSGWTGDSCTEDYDECSSDPCFNGTVCINGKNEYNCVCPEGFVGTYLVIIHLPHKSTKNVI